MDFRNFQRFSKVLDHILFFMIFLICVLWQRQKDRFYGILYIFSFMNKTNFCLKKEKEKRKEDHFSVIVANFFKWMWMKFGFSVF